jgi:hypothetical protein
MISILVCAVLAQAELAKPNADGWIALFNGKDLTGWSGNREVWRVENGYISGKAEKVDGNTFLVHGHKFSNFVLEAKFMLVKKGSFPNSGIQYRSVLADPKKFVVTGYQADIGDGWWGILYDEGGRGILTKPNPDVGKAIKEGDWNQYVITADGTRVKHQINGVVAATFDDTDEKKRPTEGIIAFQYHAPGEGFEIRFKDVRIRRLK